MRMRLLSHPLSRAAMLAAISAAGFFILGYGGIVLWGGNAHSSSPIWPATAFGMCIVLRMSRSRTDDAVMLAAMLLAGVAANQLGGAMPLLTIGFSVINILDIVAGLVATRRLAVLRLNTALGTAKFALAAAISPALFGAFLSGFLVHAVGGNGMLAGMQWFLANVLGVCMLFPLGMTLTLRQLGKLKMQQRIPEALAVFALLTAICVIAFRVSPYPLQFLVLAALVIATARFRLMGAGAGLMITGVIALSSPAAFATASHLNQVEVLQFFLAVCSLMSVRVAIVLNQRDFQQAVIERQRRRAARASRFKSRLLSHVSHEVRSPLSAIIGFSAMLESGSLPAERAQEFAHVIAHNGELLQRLHDDLLDLTRAEAGALTILAQRVPVKAMLDQCIGAIRLDATLGGKPLVMDEMEDALAVTADPIRLAQIINNLIANAYKYGDNFSPIRVRAERLADGFGRIEIVNAGPGIPQKARDMVFRPFGRLETLGRKVPGAGLGLSIAKLLVERQGGRIDFDSVPGRQTRFWIDLPLAA